MALAVGEKIFAKALTETDIKYRLHWPAEHLMELPDFDDNHHADFSARDASGNVWHFGCSRRATGLYGKPVVARGWLPFIKSKGVDFKANDHEVIFYRTIHDPEASFVITFKKRVMVFRANLNEAEI